MKRNILDNGTIIGYAEEVEGGELSINLLDEEGEPRYVGLFNSFDNWNPGSYELEGVEKKSIDLSPFAHDVDMGISPEGKVCGSIDGVDIRPEDNVLMVDSAECLTVTLPATPDPGEVINIHNISDKSMVVDASEMMSFNMPEVKHPIQELSEELETLKNEVEYLRQMNDALRYDMSVMQQPGCNDSVCAFESKIFQPYESLYFGYEFDAPPENLVVKINGQELDPNEYYMSGGTLYFGDGRQFQGGKVSIRRLG